jgi:hypothetical protein
VLYAYHHAKKKFGNVMEFLVPNKMHLVRWLFLVVGSS